MKHIRGIFVFLTLALILVSCSSTHTSTKQYKGIESLIVQRDFAAAINQIESAKGKHYTEKDRVLYYLDVGLLFHYNDDFKKSNEYLSWAEEAIDDLFTKSVSRAAASFMLNDNVLEYSGEDFEDIYINIFKAINYLNLDDFDAAFVEIRRVNEKLNLLEDKYKKLADSYADSDDAEIELKVAQNKFHNSVLARYLSMLIYRAERRFDAAEIDLNLINTAWREQSHIYNFSKPDFASYLHRTDKAKLNVMSFVGKSPYKKAFERRITTFNGFLSVSGNEPVPFSDTVYWPGLEKDFHFKFSIPFMQRRDSNIARVEVFVDQIKMAELDKIEDFGNVAVETFEVKAPLIYLKSLTRTVSKGIIAEIGKREMKKQTSPLAGMLLGIAADVAVDLSENADIRTSRFFPSAALIGEIELSEGVYDIQVKYYDRSGYLVFVDEYNQYNISKNELNFLNTFYLN